MNNQFLQHLQSITPQGMAEEKKMFVPADKFEAKPIKKIDMGDDAEELDEATRSKYIKAYRKHKVGTDTGKLDIEDAKRNAAVLRRGGADDETIKKGSFSSKVPMSHYNKVNMAKYRFGNKAQRSREDGKSSPRNVKEDMELGEAILKGAGARRSILLRKNKEEREKADRFNTQVRITGSPQTAALYTDPPEANPMAKLRTRRTEKHGAEIGGKKDFSAAEKSVKAGQQNAEEIMAVLHRKPDGTKIKVYGKGPRGTDKTVHVHKKTELGKPKFYHSQSGREVELTKGGVGLKVLDARTKKVILDRGNDAIWESTINEAAPDIGQNLKGMPKKSGRKLAYALKKGGDRGKEMARHTRKMGSHAKRWGNKLDTALSDFSKRTGIGLKEGSLGMKKGIRMSNAVINKGHTQIGKRERSALLRAISKINKETGGSGRITTTPEKYKFSDAEFAAMQGHAKKGIEGKAKYNAVRRARLSGRMGGPEMNEGYKDIDSKMPSALRSAVKTYDKIKGTKHGVSAPKKFAAGKLSHQMTPAEHQAYFGKPKPVNEGKINKKYKKTKKIAKRVIKKLGKALMTPQSAVDVMYTGRNF